MNNMLDKRVSKRWIFSPMPDWKLQQQLSSVIHTSPISTSLLMQRGITTFEEAKAFFRPTLNDLHDPFAMQGMSRAVERLQQAIANKERILVYGDYDTDGTTAVAMVYSFLKHLGADVSYYIPDRHTEGYGISEQGIAYAAEQEVRLLLCLDCGIKALRQLQKAHQKGIDTIICDHHEPGADLPVAYAILNPKQRTCTYPFQELSGCGVGFKLLQGFCKQHLDYKLLYKYLDLVALSIAADIVPVVGENRILAYHGLKQLNEAPRPGLRALMRMANLNGTISVSDLVFSLSPRINAAGRVEHAKRAVELLVAPDMDIAQQRAKRIDGYNTHRREIDRHTTHEALSIISSDKQRLKSKTTVLFKSDWHKGVLGIVASRCTEHYYRPTILLTKDQGQAVGSARSILGYNIYQALGACTSLLSAYGGHAYAAGLKLPLENLPSFIQKFEQTVTDTIQPEHLTPCQNINLTINLTDINWPLYNILQQMAPFGPHNHRPVFATHHVIAKSCYTLKNKHLKLLVQDQTNGPAYEAIGFNMAPLAPIVQDQRLFSIAYSLSADYRCSRKIQFHLKDIRC